MGKKISELTGVTTPAGTDQFEIEQGGVSYQATLTQLLQAQGIQRIWDKGTDIASAGNMVNSGAGNLFSITGTTSSNGFTTPGTGNPLVVFVYAGAVPMNHDTAPSAGYSKFYLIGATNRTVAVGDVSVFMFDGTYWREISAHKADGTSITATYASGNAIQTQYTQDSTSKTGTTVMPIDDTIPQNTEGFEVMTVSITPNNASNILVIEVGIIIEHDTGVAHFGCALFQDSVADALKAVVDYEGNNDTPIHMNLTHVMAAGTTSSTTFKVRIGSAASGTVRFNNKYAVRVFGGVACSYIKVTEYKA